MPSTSSSKNITKTPTSKSKTPKSKTTATWMGNKAYSISPSPENPKYNPFFVPSPAKMRHNPAFSPIAKTKINNPIYSPTTVSPSARYVTPISTISEYSSAKSSHSVKSPKVKKNK